MCFLNKTSIMNTPISVFGSTGFIGSRYCELYPNVIKIDRTSPVPRSKEVLYLISTVNNYNVFTDPFVDIRTNLIKLMSVLENSKRKDITFNFISSWFVYGDHTTLVSEYDQCEPKGFYAITKRTAEQLLIEYCKTFDIKYRIIRLSNVVGKTDSDASSKKNFLQHTINLMKDNQPIDVFDQGLFERDYIHVDDVCHAINLIIERGNVNDIYNVATGISTKFIDLLSTIRAILNSDSQLNFVECPAKYQGFQLDNCWMNTDKITSLGFAPRSIQQVIEELCQ